MSSRFFPRASRSLGSSLTAPRSSAHRQIPPWHRLNLRQTPQLSLVRHFGVSRLRYNQQPQDGLQNNRDHSHQAVKDSLSAVSSSDAELLSKLPPARHSHAEVPSYAMVFTCKKCSERSAHKISKQGYHSGTVLVTCPGCKNRHLISDHLKVSCKLGKTTSMSQTNRN
jgi:ribosomal protein S27E